MASTDQIDWQSALDRFGLPSFRAGQEEVISSVIAGKDCLCIMPTGGGKSLCYQLPSVVREGVTIVISPLIALMKDQVDSLDQIGVSATCINSTLDAGEQRIRLNKMVNGDYDLVYIAPERLRSKAFLDAVADSNLQLLAIDEAHCISEWGHDFRPDYARIGQFREKMGRPQTIALTATATEKVRQDIADQLELTAASTFITGFARENLSFEVWQTKSFREKQEAMLQFIESVQGCGIVYAATRKRCEELVELLRENIKRRVGFYHAGLMPDERRTIQEEFMSGEIPIIVATNAFGMGIDKSDLRFVVHYNLPGTLEAYYQEAGRAGRDGKPSRCLLLFNYADRAIQEFFIENNYPPQEVVKQVYDFLRKRKEDPIELTLQETRDELGLTISTEGIGICEQLLHKCGAIERLDSQQNMASVRISSNLPTLVDLLPREAKARRRVLREIEREVGDANGERVYFHPRHIADRLDIKVESLQRSLRELNRLEAFDYVPPFRGKAVHVVDRAKTFSKLRVDFDELNRRRKGEFDKLDAVVQYAYGQRCRQLTILEYFGDSDRRLCGNCDCCGLKGVTSSAKLKSGSVRVIESTPPDEATVYVARIVLSGVARSRGRFGKTVIGQMLCGSADKKVKKMGLSKLSTFGMLKRLSQKEVQELLDALLQARLLTQTEAQKFRPTVAVNDYGKDVMTGKRTLEQSLALSLGLKTKIIQFYKTDAQKAAAEFAAKRSPANGSDEFSVETVEDFETEDQQPGIPDTLPIADRSGNEWVDANSLIENADELLDEVLSVSPVEDAQQIEDDLTGESASARVAPAVETKRSPSMKASTSPEVSWKQSEAYWTWVLFHEGYTSQQVLEIRRLDSDRLTEHLIQAVAADQEVDPAWVIADRDLEQLRKYAASLNDEADEEIEPPWNVPSKQFELFMFIDSRYR